MMYSIKRPYRSNKEDQNIISLFERCANFGELYGRKSGIDIFYKNHVFKNVDLYVYLVAKPAFGVFSLCCIPPAGHHTSSEHFVNIEITKNKKCREHFFHVKFLSDWGDPRDAVGLFVQNVFSEVVRGEITPHDYIVQHHSNTSVLYSETFVEQLLNHYDECTVSDGLPPRNRGT
jgi:hypothetical protein